MDNQEKIRYLKRYHLNELEIIRLGEELERWRSQAERMTAGGNSGGMGSGDDRLQRAVDSMTALQDRLLEQLAARVRLRGSIEASISSISDERLRQLMRYRYIDGWTWERIAVGMNYAYRQVTRLHGKALQLLKMS